MTTDEICAVIEKLFSMMRDAHFIIFAYNEEVSILTGTIDDSTTASLNLYKALCNITESIKNGEDVGETVDCFAVLMSATKLYMEKSLDPNSSLYKVLNTEERTHFGKSEIRDVITHNE